eukprot:2300549-Amphidinium_carterae.1
MHGIKECRRNDGLIQSCLLSQTVPTRPRLLVYVPLLLAPLLAEAFRVSDCTTRLESFAPEGIQRTMDAVKPHMVYIAGVDHEGVSSSSILSAVTHA